MTICGQAAESLRRVPVQHGWEGVATEIKVQFVPPTMCRLTAEKIWLDIIFNCKGIKIFSPLKQFDYKV